MKKYLLSLIITGCFFAAVAQQAVYAKNTDGITVYLSDENENYNYETDKFSKINFNYSTKTKTFTAANAIGKFEGMLNNRVFNIVFINNYLSVSKQLNYSGIKTEIKF